MPPPRKTQDIGRCRIAPAVRRSTHVILAGALDRHARRGGMLALGPRAEAEPPSRPHPRPRRPFAQVREGWEQRKVVPETVLDFLRRFPNDGAAPLAKVYLAFVYLQQNDLIKADSILTTIGEIRPGATLDLATVARARSLRLHNAPQSALDLLRPLVGKVVDDADREIFLEELALTAIAAHDGLRSARVSRCVVARRR